MVLAGLLPFVLIALVFWFLVRPPRGAAAEAGRARSRALASAPR